MNSGSFVNLVSTSANEVLEDVGQTYSMSSTDLLLQMVSTSTGEAVLEDASKESENSAILEKLATGSAMVSRDYGPPPAKKQALVKGNNSEGALVQQPEDLKTDMYTSVELGRTAYGFNAESIRYFSNYFRIKIELKCFNSVLLISPLS